MVMVLAPARIARADGLSADDQAFFDKHSTDVVRLEPTRLTDAPVVRVFSVPLFHLKIVMKMGDGGEQSMDMIVARGSDKLLNVTRPSSDADMPDFPKMLNTSFKLQSDGDAKDMHAALDAIYPIVGDDDKKAATFVHKGNQWTFIRGKFFDKRLGFIFETDPSGTITSAKFSLSIPA